MDGRRARAPGWKHHNGIAPEEDGGRVRDLKRPQEHQADGKTPSHPHPPAARHGTWRSPLCATERWLSEISKPLEAVATGKGTARARLQRWLDLLVTSKHRKALDDAELFATYIDLTADARDVVRAHVDTLVGQLERIIADGVGREELQTADPAGAARAVFDATARFHNPVHAPEWSDPAIDAAYKEVRQLVLAGLSRLPERHER